MHTRKIHFLLMSFSCDFNLMLIRQLLNLTKNTVYKILNHWHCIQIFIYRYTLYYTQLCEILLKQLMCAWPVFILSSRSQDTLLANTDRTLNPYLIWTGNRWERVTMDIIHCPQVHITIVCSGSTQNHFVWLLWLIFIAYL